MELPNIYEVEQKIKTELMEKFGDYENNDNIEPIIAYIDHQIDNQPSTLEGIINELCYYTIKKNISEKNT